MTKSKRKDKTNKEADDTPKVEKTKVLRKNLLEKLTAEVPESELTPTTDGAKVSNLLPTVDKVSNQSPPSVDKEAVNVRQVVNPLPAAAVPVSGIDTAGIEWLKQLPVAENSAVGGLSQANCQDLKLSVAYQKQADRIRKEQREIERIRENLQDRQDLIVEKMLRIQDSLKTEVASSVHFLNLQLHIIQRAYDEYEAIHTDLLGRVPRDHRDELKTNYMDFEQLHSKLYVNLQTMITNNQQVDPSRALPLNTIASEIISRPPVTVPHLQVPLLMESWKTGILLRVCSVR